VKLRPDPKCGELSLNIFAADLYDMAIDKAKPVYQDARKFFSLTYPTFNFRELAKDVVLRLAEREGGRAARTDLRPRASSGLSETAKGRALLGAVVKVLRCPLEHFESNITAWIDGFRGDNTPIFIFRL
jgi:hypothetical protein